MKTKYFIFAASALVALASCSNDEYIGENNGLTAEQGDGSIQFSYTMPNATRATGDPFIGATAADKLGGMFVVEGTKGDEKTNSPSTTVVFDNYLVGYTANTAGTTESNTQNWEYVGKQTGIDDRMSADTWTALHTSGTAKVQSIKYWDYSVPQYDFIAWSTGKREAVTDAAVSGTKVKVTRIATGADLSTSGFTLTAASAADLMQCYYTDINTVEKANYGAPVTLTFRNMAAKIRMAIYETVPGYSVKDVQFYTAEATNVAKPGDLGAKPTTATLFTLGSETFTQSGSVLVYYPHIGTTHRDATPNQTADYNKASVTVTPDASTVTTQEFGTLDYKTDRPKEGNEPNGSYLGCNILAATYAGTKANDYYTAVIPSTDGVSLTLRVNYTLVSTDGSAEEIKVYGAKAVVPATYTEWQPNYAYTYIFKISDNSNGWTSTDATNDPAGLFPITFDAVVTNFVDANAEQTTVTTVATPSITTYQQGHNKDNKNEYSKNQTAGASTDKKDLYVQVMDNSTATPTLKNDLKGEDAEEGKKSLLFAVSGSPISEATVMDALQNRTNDPSGEPAVSYNDASPVGRNGITLTTNANIANNVTSIVNGVDDQSIEVTEGTTAKIDIDQLATGTYAYVYATTVPSSEKKVYHIAANVTDLATAGNYYEVAIGDIATTAKAAGSKAEDGKVYFVENLDAEGKSLSPKSYTFKQTMYNDDVEGLYEATVPTTKATSYTAGNFYFDVYYQNNGAYAVKVFKVVE